jgi:hypothetical protein
VTDGFFSLQTCFYLPHTNGFRLEEKKVADFHFEGLLMDKIHDLSDKKNPSVTRRCRRCTQSQLKTPFTQNFEILGSKGTSYTNFN